VATRTAITRAVVVGAVATAAVTTGATAAHAAGLQPTITVVTSDCDATTGQRHIMWGINGNAEGLITKLESSPASGLTTGLRVGDLVTSVPEALDEYFTDYGTGGATTQSLTVAVKYRDGTEAEGTGSITFPTKCGTLTPPTVTFGAQCDGLLQATVRAPANAPKPMNVSVTGRTSAGVAGFDDSATLAPGTSHDFWVPVDDAAPVNVNVDGYAVGSGRPATGCAPHRVSRTISLFGQNAQYVSTAGGGLQESVTVPGPAEQFDVIGDLPQGYVALRNKATGKYVSAVPNSGVVPAADSTTIGAAQLFAPEGPQDPDGLETSFQFTRFRAYLGALGLGTANPTGYYLAPESADGLAWGSPGQFGGRFAVVDVNDTNVTLRAHANGKYVTAESAGTAPLIANRATANAAAWEGFDLIPVGGGQVALFAHANGNWVTADNGGTQPLIARRWYDIGAWEKYTVIANADGSISLKANANNQYVTAESAGTQPLIARATAVGQWEEFDKSH
jgi:hypothetical protein